MADPSALPVSAANPAVSGEKTLPGDAVSTIDDKPPIPLNTPLADPEKAVAAVDSSEPGARWRNQEVHDIPYK